MCAISLACSPSAPAAPTTETDAFAVVRATSQAAYQAGQAALARGDYLQACVDLDAAKTNDPDSRADIQQALDQALARCLTPAANPTAPTPPAQQRTLVVATLAAGVGTALAGTPAVPSTAGQSPSTPAPTPQPAASVPSPSPPATTAPAGTAAVANAQLATWNDPQGRFSVGAPPNWTRVDSPQTLIGTGLVEFREPSGLAELDIAVHTNTRAVSPELYAASLELAMQRQVPGYASEQVVPGETAGNPSVRRVFTFIQRDAAGQDHQARGFQLVIVKGSTPYLISGSAPAEQYQHFSAAFDSMIASFQFS